MVGADTLRTSGAKSRRNWSGFAGPRDASSAGRKKTRRALGGIGPSWKTYDTGGYVSRSAVKETDPREGLSMGERCDERWCGRGAPPAPVAIPEPVQAALAAFGFGAALAS